MKTCNRLILFLIIPVAMIAMFMVSCSQNDLPNGGNPVISYVRVTDPLKSDSLLGGSLLGDMIAIVGDNLGSVREIAFNDQKAVINPTFVTNKTILVNVPNNAPLTVSNQVTLTFANGKTLQYPFVIDIPAPVLTGMVNEYPVDGETAVLQGNYFFNPISIKFSDGTPIVYSSLTQNEIQFKVPANAPSGPITITTNFGTVTPTNFEFRDKRGIFGTMDSTVSNWWHGSAYVVATQNIESIANNYLYLNQSLGAYPYFEFMVGPVGSGMELGTKNIPAAAITSPEDYNMKLEINTQAPLVAGSTFQLYIGNDMPDQRNTAGDYYTWTPVIDTKGTWQTISLPFKDVLAASQTKPVVVNPAGYDISFIAHGNANPFVANFAVDNFRIVPNK